MDEQPIDPKLAVLLLRVLRKELSADPNGRDILARFQKAPKVHSQALADYLRHRLDTEKAFKERLAEAQELPADMRTIIYGGQVERIIQIAEAGTVIINQGFPFWVGLGAVIVAVVAVGALVLTLIPKPPPPMGSGFNIAVAEFALLDANGHPTSSDVSRQFSEGLFATVQNETKLLPPALSVELRGPKDVGLVADDDTARTAAGRLNATILIYGLVKRDAQGFYQVEPQFYISDTTFSYGSEVTGPDYLGQPVTGLTLGPDQRFEFNTKLNARTQALRSIVKGLAYFSIRDYDKAADEFQDAVNTPDWEPHEGQEVAYLLLGSARLRAWDLIKNPEPLIQASSAFTMAYTLDPDYARSYLGLGAVALAQAQIPNADMTGIGRVDEAKLIEARDWYSASLSRTDQPPLAYVPTKAAFGLGQTYLLSYEFQALDGSKDLARQFFERVVSDYKPDGTPDLAWFAAHAYAGLGRLAGLDRDWKTMSDEYRQAIKILEHMQPNSPQIWIARYWSYVAFAEEKQNHLDAAQDGYNRAINIGKGTVGEEEWKAWQAALDHLKKGGTPNGPTQTPMSVRYYPELL